MKVVKTILKFLAGLLGLFVLGMIAFAIWFGIQYKQVEKEVTLFCRSDRVGLPFHQLEVEGNKNQFRIVQMNKNKTEYMFIKSVAYAHWACHVKLKDDLIKSLSLGFVS